MDGMKIENVLAWCVEVERYALENTSTGESLREAIAIIRQQYDVLHQLIAVSDLAKQLFPLIQTLPKSS